MMYKLTPRMLQHFKQDLHRYHNLFDGGRCQGWELEELLVKAIKSDTSVNHQPLWREKGHDDKADVTIRQNDSVWPINVKSGEIKKDKIVLSGHRLGRFEGDMPDITRYLNNINSNLIAVPYSMLEDSSGRHHRYKVIYINQDYLRGLRDDAWEEHGKQYIQTNHHEVLFSLRPSMSWQIWWKIPTKLLDETDWMTIT